MLAGDGVGLLAADAVSSAVRRLGATPAIEQLMILLSTDAEVSAAPRIQWAREAIAAACAPRSEVGQSEGTRIALQTWLDARLQTAETWQEEALLHLCELAAWAAWSRGGGSDYRSTDTLERASDDAGLQIASVLVDHCGASAAWAFVEYVRGLERQQARKAA